MSLAFFVQIWPLPPRTTSRRLEAPSPLLCKICFAVVRDLKPPNFEGSGNLLSFSNINGQLVRRLLKGSLFMSE